MIYFSDPNTDVLEMKRISDLLIPYTPPQYIKDDDISWLKTRDLIVDGYGVTAHYSHAKYEALDMRCLTLSCKQAPFIPFAILIKIAIMFLGKEGLTLFDYTVENYRKMYSWVVLRREDKVTKDVMNAEKRNFNGFEYYFADTSKEQQIFY